MVSLWEGNRLFPRFLLPMIIIFFILVFDGGLDMGRSDMFLGKGLGFGEIGNGGMILFLFGRYKGDGMDWVGIEKGMFEKRKLSSENYLKNIR